MVVVTCTNMKELSGVIILVLCCLNGCAAAPGRSRGRKASCVDYRRVAWGARPSGQVSTLSTPVPFYFVHHSAGARCYNFQDCQRLVRSIQDFHMDDRGWSDIGYNFLIGDDGKVYEGRGWSTVGAHARGWNTQAIGICMMGTFTDQLPSAQSLQALTNLLKCGVDKGYVRSDYKLYGHRSGGNTECPGQTLYDLLKTWPKFGACLPGGYNCD